MHIVFTDQALRDLAFLRAYSKKENKTAAREQVSRILSTITYLGEHPHLGRTGRVRKTYELTIPGTRYVVAYIVCRDTIRVIAVIRSSMEWPKTIG